MLRWNWRVPPSRAGRESCCPHATALSAARGQQTTQDISACPATCVKWPERTVSTLDEEKCMYTRTASLVTMQTERSRPERCDLSLPQAQRASLQGGLGHTDRVTHWQRLHGSYQIIALCLLASAEVCDTLNGQYSFSPAPIQLDAPSLTSRKWTQSNAL